MEISRQAHFSQDGKHRFWLLRSWTEKPRMITIIGLNPSTANAELDDPTIRSCIRLTEANGFDGFVMVNLFTFITAYPSVLLANINDGNRQESDETLRRMIANTHLTVCAWGKWPEFVNERASKVLELVENPRCFGVNKDGSPKHPLYLSKETKIVGYKK